jgi:purine-binding chemotaxis protein CheW
MSADVVTLYTAFKVGNLTLGVDAVRVVEIIRIPPRTRVHLAPPEIWGVINLRGELVTVLDLTLVMGLSEPEAEAELERRIVVISFSDEVAGFLVDEILDVVKVPAAEVQAVPQHLAEETGRHVSGIYGWDQGLLSILDLGSFEWKQGS